MYLRWDRVSADHPASSIKAPLKDSEVCRRRGQKIGSQALSQPKEL